MEPNELEQFWEDLLAFMEERRVIPVVGAEFPLYRAVAETLLTRHGLAVSALHGGAKLREHHELNDAVCAVAEASPWYA